VILNFTHTVTFTPDDPQFPSSTYLATSADDASFLDTLAGDPDRAGGTFTTESLPMPVTVTIP
jgi:hypothetical protein